MNGYRAGFNDLDSEVSIDNLPVSGQIPQWLNGSLIRTGPAKYVLKEQRLNHWFDGFAMLHNFTFSAGQVSYRNRFLQSEAYLSAQKNGKVNYREFATDPSRSIVDKFSSISGTASLTDNDNVNVTKIADEYVALTETSKPTSFDPKTLDTKEHFMFDDGLAGQVTTAHPHFDFATGESFNYLINLSAQSHYQVYKIPDASKKRQLIAKIPVSRPAYMHSFAITQNYIVLSEFPLTVNALDLALSSKPFIKNYKWKPEDGTQFTIVNRNDGKIKRIKTEAFFAFHHINAFEQGNQIILDICLNEDQKIIESLFLDNIFNKEQSFPQAHFTRFTLDLDKNTAASEQLSSETLELPRINYSQYNSRPYRFAYGVSANNVYDFVDQLIKIDIQNKSSYIWREDGTYPGEPVFVAKPDSPDEDGGVLLSVVLDSRVNKSFLLVMDAHDFKELGRALLPHHIPFGFHGNFYPQ